MNKTLLSAFSAAELARPSSGLEILAIGDIDAWKPLGGQDALDGKVSFQSFRELSGCLLELLKPALVVSPLLTREFDCVDLARRLNDLGYSGAYRALATGLPMPGIVKAEVRQACPALDFDIIEWPAEEAPATN